MQLVAYGAQDVYLTGNPQITFFKVVYRRHTNFSVESVELTFNGTADFGRKVSCPITRNGDLVGRMYLKSTATATPVSTITTDADDGIGVKTFQTGTPFATLTHTINFSALASGIQTIEDNGAGGHYTPANGFIPGNIVAIGGALANATNGGNFIIKSVAANGNSFTVQNAAGAASAADAGVTLIVHPVHRWNKHLGHALIDNVELSIGGSRIDKQYGVWMQIWDQLSRSNNLDGSMNTCIGNTLTGGENTSASVDLFVPLQFFCNRNPGLALPLIALQYHDVRVDFELSSAADCSTTPVGVTYGINSAVLLVEYVYLDSEERKRFAQASHEYLIEQLQYTGTESVSASQTSDKFRLNFNHPCKELVWAFERDAIDATLGTAESAANKFDFTHNGSAGNNGTSEAQLQLNGHDRFSTQPGVYFNYVQTLQHHTCTPSVGVNVYSFALNPEDHQPSGTCNFSRIDNAQLNITYASSISAGNLHIFATNYNVLRVMSGMGGLAYSN